MLHDGGHVTENDNETQNEIIICEIMSCLKEYVIFLVLLCFKNFMKDCAERNLTLTLFVYLIKKKALTHKFNSIH